MKRIIICLAVVVLLVISPWSAAEEHTYDTPEQSHSGTNSNGSSCTWYVHGQTVVDIYTQYGDPYRHFDYLDGQSEIIVRPGSGVIDPTCYPSAVIQRDHDMNGTPDSTPWSYTWTTAQRLNTYPETTTFVVPNGPPNYGDPMSYHHRFGVRAPKVSGGSYTFTGWYW